MGKEKKQLKYGVILSYISQAINILTGLIYTPVMLKLLGQSEYGLYQLVSSTVSYLSLIGLGFGSSYQRFYAIAKLDETNGEKDEIARTNGLFLLIFCIMSMVCLLCGGAMISNTEVLFGTGLSHAEKEISRVLLVLLVFNMSITFPNSLFTSYIISQERFIFQKLLIIFQNLLNPFVCLPLLLMGYGSIMMVLVSSVITVVGFIVNILYCKRKLKMRIIFVGFKKRKFREMWGFTIFIFINEIVNQINWGVDKFLLGRICGTSAVAIYSVGGMIQHLYAQFSKAISNVFIPRVNRIVVDESDDKKLTNLFTYVGQLQAMILSVIVCGFISFGKEFVLLWAGKGYNEAYVIAVMYLVILWVPYIQNLGIEIQRAKNLHRIRSVVYGILAIVNIVISCVLIPEYGVIGAAVGTCISLFLGNILFMNFYYHCKVKLDMKFFWRKIARLTPCIIIMLLIGFFLKKMILIKGWLMLFIVLAIYCMIYIALIFMLMYINRKRNKNGFLI